MALEDKRSRHTTYFIIILAIVSGILTYYCWSLSIQHDELTRQLSDVLDRIKLCSNGISICEIMRNGTLKQLHITEPRILELKTKAKLSAETIAEIRNDIDKQMKIIELKEKEFVDCKTVWASMKIKDDNKTVTLVTMRFEKESLATKLIKSQEKKNELESIFRAANLTPSSFILNNGVVKGSLPYLITFTFFYIYVDNII